MKTGDIVENKDGPHATTYGALRSGCEAYWNAVVVSMDPFVLVSQEGDMMWSSMKPEYFVVTDKNYDTTEAFARWKREQPKRKKS